MQRVQELKLVDISEESVEENGSVGVEETKGEPKINMIVPPCERKTGLKLDESESDEENPGTYRR